MLYSCTHMYSSFVIFDIWALGRSGCQWHKQIKLTHTQRNLRTGFWDDVKKDWLKTKIQNVDAGAGPNTIHINNPAVEYITMFTFLVSDVDSDGYCDSEVHRRLGIASSIMGQLDNVWHQKRLSLSTKLRIYVSLVLSLVVLYGSETWSMSKNWQWQGPVISHAISTQYPGSEMERQDHQYRNKGDNRANRSTFSSIDATHFLVTSADYPGIHLFYKHHIYPLVPSPAHLPLTGSVRRAIHGELGFNRWKKIWVYPSVPVNSQPWTAHCGDCYDPQLVERSSGWLSSVLHPHQHSIVHVGDGFTGQKTQTTVSKY